MRGRIVAALLAVGLSAVLTGGVVAATQSSDEAALQPVRAAGGGPGHREAHRRADAEDDDRGQAEPDPAVVGRADQGAPRGGLQAGRRRVLPHRPGADQQVPEAGDGLGPEDPDPLRLRHDPRLPHDLPDPARRGQLVRPERRRDRPQVRRPRVGGGRPEADLQPDGRRLARAALGPHLRGGRRGPVPQLGVRGRAREGRPGHATTRSPTRSSPASSTTPPTASRRAGATTTRPTCRCGGCTTSTCRRSRRRSTPAATPRCARSTRSTGRRAAPTRSSRPTCSRRSGASTASSRATTRRSPS